VRVGDNKRYLRRGNEPFFPVGHNLFGPKQGAGDTQAPPSSYVQYFDQMKNLSESGANYFRFITCPWNTEIEFEHLGNYSNRMTGAWEFDNILDSANAYDLVMHFNMMIHFTFERPSHFARFKWDWSAAGDTLNTPVIADGMSGCFRPDDLGYCYRKDLDIENPAQFFENDSAIYYYQNRLRYMMARWSYSTSIGVIEHLSEANHAATDIEIDLVPGVGCFPGPSYSSYRKDTLVHPERVYNWHNEMSRFLKEDITMTEHPISVNYAAPPLRYCDVQ